MTTPYRALVVEVTDAVRDGHGAMDWEQEG